MYAAACSPMRGSGSPLMRPRQASRSVNSSPSSLTSPRKAGPGTPRSDTYSGRARAVGCLASKPPSPDAFGPSKQQPRKEGDDSEVKTTAGSGTVKARDQRPSPGTGVAYGGLSTPALSLNQTTANKKLAKSKPTDAKPSAKYDVQVRKTVGPSTEGISRMPASPRFMQQTGGDRSRQMTAIAEGCLAMPEVFGKVYRKVNSPRLPAKANNAAGDRELDFQQICSTSYTLVLDDQLPMTLEKTGYESSVGKAHLASSSSAKRQNRDNDRPAAAAAAATRNPDASCRQSIAKSEKSSVILLGNDCFAPVKIMEPTCINETFAVDHLRSQLIEEKTITATLRRQLMYLRKELGKSRADLLREQQLRKRADEWTEYLEAELESYVKSRADAEKRYLSMLQVVKGIDRFTKRLLHKYVSLHRKLENSFDRQGFAAQEVPSIPGLRNSIDQTVEDTEEDEQEAAATLSAGTVNLTKKMYRQGKAETGAKIHLFTSPGPLASSPAGQRRRGDFEDEYLNEAASGLRDADLVGLELISDDANEYDQANWSSNNLECRADASISSYASTGGEWKAPEAPSSAEDTVRPSSNRDEGRESPSHATGCDQPDENPPMFDCEDSCLQELTQLLVSAIRLNRKKCRTATAHDQTTCEMASSGGETGANCTGTSASSLTENVTTEDQSSNHGYAESEAGYASKNTQTPTPSRREKRQRKGTRAQEKEGLEETEKDSHLKESCEENEPEVGHDQKTRSVERAEVKVASGPVAVNRRYVERLLREMCSYCDRYRPGDKASGLKSLLKDSISKQFLLQDEKTDHRPNLRECTKHRRAAKKN